MEHAAGAGNQMSINLAARRDIFARRQRNRFEGGARDGVRRELHVPVVPAMNFESRGIVNQTKNRSMSQPLIGN